MMTETDRDNLVSRIISKLDRLADEKDGEASNLPKSENDKRHYLQGMAQAYRDISTRIEAGDWI